MRHTVYKCHHILCLALVAPQIGDGVQELRSTIAVIIAQLHAAAARTSNNYNSLKVVINEKDHTIEKLQNDISGLRAAMDRLDKVILFLDMLFSLTTLSLSQSRSLCG